MYANSLAMVSYVITSYWYYFSLEYVKRDVNLESRFDDAEVDAWQDAHRVTTRELMSRSHLNMLEVGVGGYYSQTSS